MRARRVDRREAALAGLAATCTITAIAAVVHLIAYRVPFPARAIAQSAVGATSGRFDSFFIQLFGHWAERLLVIGLAAGFAAAGALAALIPARWLERRWAWPAVPLPLWALTIAIYSAPEPFLGRWTFAAVSLPMFLVGGGVGGWTYTRLRTRGPHTVTAERVSSPLEPELSRRSMLAVLGVGGVGVALGASGLSSLVGGPTDTGSIRLAAGRVVRARRPSPAPGDAAFDRIEGLTPEITSTADFYVVDKEILNPVLGASSWRLRVHGLVDREIELTFDELRSMLAHERYQTLECISNRIGGHLMSTALWTGVPLRDVLTKAGVRSSARTVVFRSAGGYSESHPIDKAMEPTTLVAFGMNRHELPREHGFPARLLTVGTYGMKNPKWLTDVELIEGEYRGYWEVRGWSPDADPKITTRIDVPRDGASVQAKAVIAGIAYAGDRGISRVEVSTDDGRSWADARLKTELSPYAWRLWMYEWRPARSGMSRILARAFDRAGRPQTSTHAEPFPNGAEGLDGITLEAE